MIKRIIFFLLAALLAGNAAACGREERNVSPSEDAAPVREKAKEDSLIPGKPSQIPQKYFEESEHPGTLAELNYDTYESMTYEDHAQVLHKRAIVYLPYGYSEDKSYNVFYLMHGGWSDETTYIGTVDQPAVFKNVLDNGISDGKSFSLRKIIITSWSMI